MAEYRITPIDRLNQVEQVQPVRRRDAGSQFGSMLQREIASASQERESFSVAFSKHAISRAEERGIQVTPHLMDQLAGSVVRAQAKGATNAKVITAITQEEMRESVFTNIDGAVFL